MRKLTCSAEPKLLCFNHNVSGHKPVEDLNMRIQRIGCAGIFDACVCGFFSCSKSRISLCLRMFNKMLIKVGCGINVERVVIVRLNKKVKLADLFFNWSHSQCVEHWKLVDQHNISFSLSRLMQSSLLRLNKRFDLI